MNRALLTRRLRQLHLWLGLAIGAQVGIWLISGLFMTWFPIEEVRGEHLTANRYVPLDWSEEYVPIEEAIERAGSAGYEITAKRLSDIPVWQVSGFSTVLVDARTGEVISPLNKTVALQLAQEGYTGAGEVMASDLLEDPPREYGRAGPVWRIDFGPADAASLYVDPSTGDVRAVRTGLWRAFDFMWGLHIMDWSSRENFNSWWLKMTAGVAIVFFLAGTGLMIMRLMSMIGRRER